MRDTTSVNQVISAIVRVINNSTARLKTDSIAQDKAESTTRVLTESSARYTNGSTARDSNESTTVSMILAWQTSSNNNSLSNSSLPNYELFLWFEHVPRWYTVFMTFTLFIAVIATIFNCLTVISLLRYLLYYNL